MKLLLVFLIIGTIFAATTGTDYCSETLCGRGVRHIACGHSGQFDATCPANAKIVTINGNLKRLLVDTHNEKRNFIAGGGDAKHRPASRMATMQWDNELAMLAELNVKQCQIAHDQCHNTDAFKYSGQNLAWFGFTGPVDHADRLKAAVELWYDEVRYSRQSYIDSFPSNYNGPTIGHFTVMMADRNIRVGCAAATYNNSGDIYLSYLIACNYATTNIINFPIYASANRAAAACTTGTNPKYPNLCSVSEVYDVNKLF